MDGDTKTLNSNDNSIEEDIEEAISAGSSNGRSHEQNSKSQDVLAKKRQLFDIESGDHFTIDDDALSGGMLVQHFQIEESPQIGEPLSKNDDFNQRTENDVSDLDDRSQLYVKSLDFKSSILNCDPRDCISLESAVRIIQPRSARSEFEESFERDHSLEEVVESNHSIDVTLNDNDLSSLDPNIDINNESQINKILGDSKNSSKSDKSQKNFDTETEESDMSDLKRKILSLNDSSNVALLHLIKDVSHEQVSDQGISVRQMERIQGDFNKEALEDITEESEKVSQRCDNDNTSNDFDSIISLNMIQMLENKVKDLQEIVSGKDVCLASLSMQLDSANRRESFVNNESRDSLRDLLASGRDSCSLVTTSTEYRTIQEDLGQRVFDFHTELIHRDHLIEKLTDSLQQSMQIREQLQNQSEKLTSEVQQLRKQLTETLDAIKKPYWPRDQESSAGQRLSEISIDLVSESDEDLDRQFLTDNEEKLSTSNRNSKERQLSDPGNMATFSFDNFDPDMFCVSKQIEQFQKYLNPDEVRIFFMVQKKFDDFLSQEIEKSKMKYDGEVKILTEQLESEKGERDLEINRLRQMLTNVKNGSTELIQLRQELETIHALEMEKLRTYFEKKCADLEKHYSEEIFSQKSQKNSADTSSDMSDQDNIQSDNARPLARELLAKRRSREELYASPTHRQMTPTTLLESLGDISVTGTVADFKNLEKEPNITVEELKVFYKEKIQEIGKRHDETVKKLNDKLRRFESKYADDEFMALLSETAADDQHWPAELILLREKFTAKSQLEIAQLQIKHEDEMSRLKADFDKQLNRKSKRNSTFDLSRDLDQIASERDNLRELSNTFRYLLYELAKCVSICEDDLNDTLIGELQKHGIYHQSNQPDHNVSECGDGEQCLEHLNLSAQSNQLQTTLTKRLRMVPDVSGLLSAIEDPSLIEFISDTNCDYGGFNLKDCLEKLKGEATGLLVLSENLFKRRKQNEESGIEKGDSCEEEDGLKSGSNRPTTLVRANSLNDNLLREKKSEQQTVLLSLPPDLNRLSLCDDSHDGDVYTSTGPPSEINFQVHELKNRLVKSESDRLKLQGELEITIIKSNELTIELNNLREQLSGLISAKEDFSEGYGISQFKSPRLRKENASTSFTQLQEKARNLLGTPTKNMSESTSVLLQLIEEFCREGDKVVEEGKRDRDDLQAQFEQMDRQIRDLTQQVNEYEVKKDKSEIELKASIDKIFVLREIISELETEIKTKSLNELVLNEKVKELETFISTQNRSNETLQHEVDSLKSDIGHGYQEKIAHLEDQLRNSRSTAEQNVVFEQLTEQLRDIETTLDQKTKTLESLHQAICSNSCSTNPSEDVSVLNLPRDTNSTPQASPIHTPRHHSLPIDEVQRVFQKLSKHTRVEEAAIKRIRDLEMQVVNIRTGYGELQNERDVLQERMSEQLQRISSLQSKLDEQRRRAEELQRQGTSDLAIRIHDLQSEVYNLKETLSARDKQIINLKNHLEQSKVIIDRQEAELALTIQGGDRGTIDRLEAELKTKTEVVNKLKEKMKKEMINKLALPDLMETMLADKNEEIDHLKEQLESKEKEFQGILDINLSQANNSLKEKDKSDEHVEGGKLSGRTLSDIVSISEYDEPDVIRRAVTEVDTPLLVLPGSSFPEKTMESSKCMAGNLTEKRSGDLTMFDVPSSDAMHTFDQPNFFMNALIPKGNNSTTPSFAPRQINFSEFVEDSKLKESTQKSSEIIDITNVENLRTLLKSAEEKAESLKKSLEAIESEKIDEINRLKLELAAKCKLYDDLMVEKTGLEAKMASLQKQLLRSGLLEEDLKSKTNQLTELEHALNEKETNVKELEKHLQNKTVEIDSLCEQNSSLKNKMEKYNFSDDQVKTLNQQIDKLTSMIREKDDSLSKFQKNQLNFQTNEKNYLERIADMEKKQLKLSEKQNDETLAMELISVRAELSEKVLLYEKLLLDVESYQKKIEKLNQSLKDKGKIIDSLSNDSRGLRDVIATIQSRLNETDSLNEHRQRIKQLEQRNATLEAELDKARSQNSESSKPYSLDEIAEQVEKELNYSAQLDSNILKAIESEEENNLDNQHKTDANKSVEANLIGQVQILKVQLETEKKSSAQLQQQLNEIKMQSQDIQQQDADIIEAMRLRLQEAIAKEGDLHKILDDERDKCERLTVQVSVLQRTEARKTSLLLKSPPDSPRRAARAAEDSDLYERQKGEMKLLAAQNERERERVNDLQRVLEREKSRFEKELSDRVEYGEKLKREMDKVAREKDIAGEEAEHLQERLTLASREIESLETRISTLQEAETRRAHRRGKERVETTQNTVELQELRTKVSQLETERDHLNHMIIMLRGDIERGAQRETKLAESLANSGNENSIPDQFMQKLKEMNFLLVENTKENRQMAETLQYLTDERKTLQRKCEELEANCHTGMLAANNLTDLEERANHLFGKYLRVESHRKALVHQKRYLLIVLQTHQESEMKALTLLNGGEPKRPKRISFKSVALIIIAIERMKFIVRRWQSGKVVVSKSIFNLAIQRRTPSTSSVGGQRTGKNILSSLSPPCRDRPPNILNSQIRPLQAPGLISECTDKMDWTSRR